jgi:hypothetical protein
VADVAWRLLAHGDVGLGAHHRTASGWRGHIGATCGPQMTRSQRTTEVTTGASSAQLDWHTPPPVAGRRDPARLSDTEEDGGSTPPAPTTPALTRDFADWMSPPVADGLSLREWRWESACTRPEPTPRDMCAQHWRLAQSGVLVRCCGARPAPAPAGSGRDGRQPVLAGGR